MSGTFLSDVGKMDITGLKGSAPGVRLYRLPLGFQNVAIGLINWVARLTWFSWKKIGHLTGAQKVDAIRRLIY